MEMYIAGNIISIILPLFAMITGIFVITTRNAIISVLNLIVLYVLVAFYLIHMGLAYLGISYIIIYIGAIAILFLFVIMMIDIEVVEKKNNNYLILLFFLLGSFIYTVKSIVWKLKLFEYSEFFFFEDEKYLLKASEWIELRESFDLIPSNNNYYNEIISSLNFDKEQLQLNTEELVLEINRSIAELTKGWEEISSMLDNKNELTEEEKGNRIDEYISSEADLYELEMDESIRGREEIIDKVSELGRYISQEYENSYIWMIPDWNLAVYEVSQISGIGEVLYSVYHSYLYILSIILLLGLVGAIILTADNPINSKEKGIKVFKKDEIKVSSIGLINVLNFNSSLFNRIIEYIMNSLKRGIGIEIISWKLIKYYFTNARKSTYLNTNDAKGNKDNNGYNDDNDYNGVIKKVIKKMRYSASSNIIFEKGDNNLVYYVDVVNVVAGALLFVNILISVKKPNIDKGGAFECGFTSFLQTRERFNVAFYRIGLIFLILDLEIILIFPYPSIIKKEQTMSKNNVLTFIYVLVGGFFYELKEGALNIVKNAQRTTLSGLGGIYAVLTSSPEIDWLTYESHDLYKLENENIDSLFYLLNIWYTYIIFYILLWIIVLLLTSIRVFKNRKENYKWLCDLILTLKMNIYAAAYLKAKTAARFSLIPRSRSLGLIIFMKNLTKLFFILFLVLMFAIFYKLQDISNIIELSCNAYSNLNTIMENWEKCKDIFLNNIGKKKDYDFISEDHIYIKEEEICNDEKKVNAFLMDNSGNNQPNNNNGGNSSDDKAIPPHRPRTGEERSKWIDKANPDLLPLEDRYRYPLMEDNEWSEDEIKLKKKYKKHEYILKEMEREYDDFVREKNEIWRECVYLKGKRKAWQNQNEFGRQENERIAERFTEADKQILENLIKTKEKMDEQRWEMKYSLEKKHAKIRKILTKVWEKRKNE